MTIREQAERNFKYKVIGKLRRCKDVHYGVQYAHYPMWIDEAGSEYLMSDDGKRLECIVTPDGGVL